jgi:hypothetical protein
MQINKILAVSKGVLVVDASLLGNKYNPPKAARSTLDNYSHTASLSQQHNRQLQNISEK